MKFRILVSALALAVTACGAKKTYQEEAKLKVLPKSAIDTESVYLYVPSTGSSPRRTSASRPHWMGDAKKVRFVFTENDLKVVEVESDDRFSDNTTNDHPVLSIPVRHVEYTCAEDGYGRCTGREEQDEHIEWHQRTMVEIKPQEMAVQEVNFLPIEISNFIYGSCYNEIDSQFVDAKIEDDAINLITEKTYQTGIGCVDWVNFDGFTELVFTVTYHYSFAKLDSIGSSDYKPAEYTPKDEDTFGFFTTRKHLLDVDNNDMVDSESHLFDRWNPNRQKVVFYLNEPFAKPEYKTVRTATYKAVETINHALNDAGTSLRIELRDPAPGLSPHDVRNNMIVMVEDPQASGVIGYGPHASIPDTGEIVHARTVMYLGTIKKFLRYTYDDILAEKNKVKQSEVQYVLAEHLKPQEKKDSENSMSILASTGSTDLSTNERHIREITDPSAGKNIPVEMLRDAALNPLSHSMEFKDAKERLELLSRVSYYPAEMFNFHSALENAVSEVIEEVGAKPWLELTDAEQAKVVDALLPYVWIPTLVHELGHNLGLRHNFAGSEDESNFYTPEELEEMGAPRPFKYSSIMDYSYSNNGELPIMGKYDIAALRFGYAEKVELTDGSLVSRKEFLTNDELSLKPYQYCTDEHVGANPNCNRFDEGTSLIEITQHLIDAYHKRYHRSNFRNGRASFSLVGDFGYLMGVKRTFLGLRLMFERYEKIKNDFGLTDDSPLWESIDFLKELKQSVRLAAEFYADVLRTPENMCAIAAVDQPNVIVALLPLRDLTPNTAIDCFDSENVSLNEKYMVVGQAGKAITSRKSRDNPNKYVDQIDVRGIWIDKVLAAESLLGRRLGSALFDGYQENFLHFTDKSPEVIGLISSLVTDNLRGPVEITDLNGQKLVAEISYKLHDSHRIPEPMSTAVKKYLGMPDEATYFGYELLGIIEDSLNSRERFRQNAALASQLVVFSSRYRRNDIPDSYLRTEIMGAWYYAPPTSTMGAQLMAGLQVVRVLDQLSREDLISIIQELESGSSNEAATAADSEESSSDLKESAKRLGKEVLIKYLNDAFGSQEFYEGMIAELSSLSGKG